MSMTMISKKCRECRFFHTCGHKTFEANAVINNTFSNAINNAVSVGSLVNTLGPSSGVALHMDLYNKTIHGGLK